MERFDEVVCDPRLRLADLRAHLESGSAAPFLGEYRVASTSGSTGLRGVFAFTHREFAHWTAASLRAMVRAGGGPGMRLLAIGAPSPAAVTRQLFADFQAATPDAPRLSVVTPLPELVEALNAHQPQGLVGYPTLAGILAGEQLAGRLRIRPRFGLYGAEPLTPVIRRRIREAWGFEPASIYAATEALAIGSSTPADECLEVSEDVLVVEVVDQHDRPVPPGTPGAKVLVTNLVDYAQPLIRYELSDVVTLADGPNPSGRPYRRIASIEGRRMDILHLPRRGGGEVALHPTGLSPAFASLPEVREYQVLHDHRGLHARVVLAPGADPATPQRLRRALAAAVEAAGAVAPPVEVVEVDALEREPGARRQAQAGQVDRPEPPRRAAGLSRLPSSSSSRRAALIPSLPAGAHSGGRRRDGSDRGDVAVVDRRRAAGRRGGALPGAGARPDGLPGDDPARGGRLVRGRLPLGADPVPPGRAAPHRVHRLGGRRRGGAAAAPPGDRTLSNSPGHRNPTRIGPAMIRAVQIRRCAWERRYVDDR
jgi:phenylacetate-CoA ligase